MGAKAKLRDIVDGMESLSDEASSYFDRQEGKIISMMDDYMRMSEDDEEDLEDLKDWEAEEVKTAGQIADDAGGRFIPLPDKFEIDEWGMMLQFAENVEDPVLSEALQRAIHGPGAFRYFRDRVHEAGLADQWYKFREECYREIARDWCEEHGIEFEE